MFMTDNVVLNLALYKKVYLVRSAEEKIRKHYMEDEMKTPTHLSVGEEAIAAGVCQALGLEDQIFGTYRSHGIYLARTEETHKFFSELFGKETGIAKGKSGSMHLSAVEAGFMGSSAVVATTIPVAVGAAFVNKHKKNGKMVAVFFGDGAIEEGVFWESVNAACTMHLPILFICEDNRLAIHSHFSTRQGFRSISNVVSQFECNVFTEDTTDPEIIYTLTRTAIDKAKTTQKPSFIHLKYYRYYEHVGMDQDFKFGYRSKEEFDEWYKRDPVFLQRNKLIKLGLSEEKIIDIESKILTQIEKSFIFSKQSNFPDKTELHRDVYI